jgi:hypothetical protein
MVGAGLAALACLLFAARGQYASYQQEIKNDKNHARNSTGTMVSPDTQPFTLVTVTSS